MDLMQIIEGRRFLGREFLVWMWFETELFEGQMSAHGVGSFEMFFEKQIVLESGGQRDKEQSKLRGANPAASPEAREALRQGKTPTQASIKLTRGEQEFSFVFNADPFTTAAVKLPSLLKEDDDEPFYERISLVEDLEAHIDALYGDFAVLRSSEAWEGAILPAILSWAHETDEPSVDAYRKARADALQQGRGKAKARAKAEPEPKPKAPGKGKAPKKAAKKR